jgi:hypothetical protein
MRQWRGEPRRWLNLLLKKEMNGALWDGAEHVRDMCHLHGSSAFGPTGRGGSLQPMVRSPVAELSSGKREVSEPMQARDW